MFRPFGRLGDPDLRWLMGLRPGGLLNPLRLKPLELFPVFQDTLVLPKIFTTLCENFGTVATIIQTGLQLLRGRPPLGRSDSHFDCNNYHTTRSDNQKIITIDLTL